jgi:hypothetical protein
MEKDFIFSMVIQWPSIQKGTIMNSMKFAFKFFRSWLPLAVVIVALCEQAYLTAQQLLRQGANDPQIQLSEDFAASLNPL